MYGKLARTYRISLPYSTTYHPDSIQKANQSFFHNSPTKPTKQQTDEPTDGIGERPVPTPVYALLYYSDATNNDDGGWLGGVVVRASDS